MRIQTKNVDWPKKADDLFHCVDNFSIIANYKESTKL